MSRDMNQDLANQIYVEKVSLEDIDNFIHKHGYSIGGTESTGRDSSKLSKIRTQISQTTKVGSQSSI